MKKRTLSTFEQISLNDGRDFFVGELPFEVEVEKFNNIWSQHPDDYHTINMPSGPVKTPRWQQAFGKDYEYTGNVNAALPVIPELEPFLRFVQDEIDSRLNGLLLNWYDGKLGHYIGRHRDSTKNMIVGSPIVTISLGEERVFRLRPWKQKGKVDFTARHGSVFVTPFETNLAWTHEVTRRKRDQGRRISITARAFQE